VCDGVDNDCDGVVDNGSAADECDDGIDCTVDACSAAACANQPNDASCELDEVCAIDTGCTLVTCPCLEALDAANWNTLGASMNVMCDMDPGVGGAYSELRPETAMSDDQTQFEVTNLEAPMVLCEVEQRTPEGENITVESISAMAELQACYNLFTSPSAAAECVTPP